jgi:Amt family ammonium transporter
MTKEGILMPFCPQALRRWSGILALMVVGMLAIGAVRLAWAGDPAGATTGNASDIVGMTPGAPQKLDEIKAAEKTEPLAVKLADVAGQNRVAINLVWLLVTGYLVMFMQAGFALVETGFCRAKNAAHVMMTNFMIYGLGMLGFWICGFAFMFGAVGAIGTLGGTAPLTGTEHGITIGGHTFGLLATNGFFLTGSVYDVGVLGLFLFQMVFMDTTATIPTGAMAERWKFSAFVIYGFFVSMILYPIYGNWAWGGGWLATLGKEFGLGNGYCDFAGSGVVHAVGGFCALAGAMVLGPRIGKYNRDGSANVIPPHNLPMAMLGTFILAFGWFGFNPGSTLGASGGGNLRISIVATVTMLASAGGAFAAMCYWWMRHGKPDPSMCVNGMLAGLVAITAPSGWVNPICGVLIGVIAGIVVCEAVPFFDKVHVDDPVGAISVHGVCGLWGLISVGLFADGTWGGGYNGVASNVTGLFFGGGVKQLIAQLIGCVVVVVWAWGVSYVFFKAQNAVMGIRSKAEDEIAGLDLPEMGVEGYPSAHGTAIPGTHDRGPLGPTSAPSPAPARMSEATG